jgi:hypothetical protein
MLVGGNEANIVEQLAAAHREDQQVFATASPAHQILRPSLQPRCRDQSAIGDGPGEHRDGGVDDVASQHRMDSVRGDDDVGLDAYPVVKADHRELVVLAKTHAAMTRVHDPCGQRGGQDCDHIRPVHAELRDALRVCFRRHNAPIGAADSKSLQPRTNTVDLRA